MSLEQKLEAIFSEKGVMTVEFYGLDLICISVQNKSGDLGKVDIFLSQCTISDILAAIRRYAHG